MRQEGAAGESLCDYSYLASPHSEFTADAGWAMLRHTNAKAPRTGAEGTPVSSRTVLARAGSDERKPLSTDKPKGIMYQITA